jgi:hypothetical protein
MRGPIHQELSPAAAQRILRSIARRDWTKLDQMAGATHGCPVFVAAPAEDDIFDDFRQDVEEDFQQDVSDHIGEADDRTPSPTFPWQKRAGAWYLNEVPDELIDDYENELWTPHTRIDLREAGNAAQPSAIPRSGYGSIRFSSIS